MQRIVLCTFLIGLVFVGTSSALEERWVPASASNAGDSGTDWTTDAWIYTAVADSPIQVTVAFFPDVEGSEDPEEVTIDLPAISAVEILDLVGELFGENRPGALRFRSEHPFEVRTRTFNDGGEGGSFGQAIAGLTLGETLKGALMIGAANVPGPDGVRTNIGVVNPSDSPQDVLVNVFDQETQQFLDQFQRIELGPNGWFQGNVFDLVGAADQSFENAIVFAIASREAFSYASRIDNRSGDGTFVLPFDGSNQYIIQVNWDIAVTVTYGPEITLSSIVYTGEDGLDVRVESPETPWTKNLSFMSPAEFCYAVEGSGSGFIEGEILATRGSNPAAVHTHSDTGTGTGVVSFTDCVELY